VSVELGEGDHIALGWSWFPMICHRCNLLRPRRGNTGTQEPLPLELQQPALRHRRRAPVVGGDESHRLPDGEGERLFYCSRMRARARWQGSRGKNKGRRRKEQRQGDPRIFIDGNHQRTDPANTVTPLVNTPPNGPYSSHGQGATNSTPVQCRNGSRRKRRA